MRLWLWYASGKIKKRNTALSAWQGGWDESSQFRQGWQKVSAAMTARNRRRNWNWPSGKLFPAPFQVIAGCPG